MIDKIKSLNAEILPRIYCQINSWEFPDELIEFKPLNWELLPMQLKKPILQPAYDYLCAVVPEKERSREWNKDRMTNEEFEHFWANRKPLSEGAIELLKAFGRAANANLN